MNMQSQFVPVLERQERRLRNEIEREQIAHIPLTDYAVGSPRYERLIQAMDEAQRFQFDSIMEFNV